MAQGKRFVCDACSKGVEAWSDGNPYYIDEGGVKQYAYHPDHEKLERCIGNDSPHLCLGCGASLNVDSRAPIDRCPGCGSGRLERESNLEGKPCPYCKRGSFFVDPGFFVIS